MSNFKIRIDPAAATQYVITTLISMKVDQIVQEQLVERTALNPDGLPIKFIGGTAGALVGGAVKPVTDAVIDRTAAKVISWRSNRKSKKETSTE